MARWDVAIIGAGVGGLAAAIALHRTGHRITLFERFEQSRPVGSGLMLQPTGLAALARLGLAVPIRALGARIDRLHGVTDRGRTVFDLAYADLAPGLHAVAVHRAALHGTLWAAFAASGAAIETGQTILGVDPRAGGRLAVMASQGRNLGTFDLVVDASGTHSPLRGLLSQPGAKPFIYGAVWASVPDIGIAPASLAQRYVAARVMAGICRWGG